MLQLKPGQYFGHTLWERVLPGLRLTLSSYEPQRIQPKHNHANPTFFLLLDGDNSDTTKHGTYRQTPYTLIFHPTTTDHASEASRYPVRGLNIEYESPWLARHQLSHSDLHDYRIFSSPSSRLAALRFLGSAFQPGSRIDAELETQAFEFLVPIADGHNEQPTVHRCLRRAEEYLPTHFRQPISLRDVAEEVQVHPVYLARIFRKVHQCNISQYLRTLRLAEAAALVMQGEPLAQAAYTAGFADQAHFSRCCSSAMGFSPKHFRHAQKAIHR